MRVLFMFGILLAYPGLAFAHIGHLGEVAGHSHWIALGAGLAAAAIAALLGKKTQETEASSEDDTEADDVAEPSGASPCH